MPHMKPSDFRIVPLPNDVARQAREACKNGVPGHALIAVNSRNAYPCRQCLRWAERDERVILFTYESIPSGLPYSESGPIFIHERPCAPYAEMGKYPSDFRAGRVIRAYDSSQNMIDATVVDGREPEAVVAKLFANPKTEFLQVRSVTRGCFTFRIER
jgi:hypothetical protein